MRAIRTAVWVLAVLSSGAALAGDDGPRPEAGRDRHPVLFYLPNRLFDLLDVVRLRARVGPGRSAGIRVTEVADVFLGSHTGLYAGLPGPRGERGIPWPVGVESEAGVELSLFDATASGERGPGYGPTEVGLGFHAFAVGLDVGFEPLELLDFVAGLFLLDPRHDDF